jgi:hypothetical protein
MSKSNIEDDEDITLLVTMSFASSPISGMTLKNLNFFNKQDEWG